MSRRVVGWLGLLEPDGVAEHPSDFAPFVSASVEYLDEPHDVDFMIDTGSDFTILMPTDAYHILGDAYFNLDFRSSDHSTLILGVGDEGYVALPIEVRLLLDDDGDARVAVSITAWMTEPRPDFPAREGNWVMPSIFGRDAIWPGDLEFRYSDSTVTLLRPDDE